MKSRAKSPDQLELLVTRDVDRAVRDLDMGKAMLGQPRLELVELALGVDGLEQRPATDDRCIEAPVERDLLLEVVRDVARAPAELDDVDEVAGGVEHPLDVADVQTLVHHVGETVLPGLTGTGGNAQPTVLEPSGAHVALLRVRPRTTASAALQPPGRGRPGRGDRGIRGFTAWHRAPSACRGHGPGRRGRASCRGRRSRR